MSAVAGPIARLTPAALLEAPQPVVHALLDPTPPLALCVRGLLPPAAVAAWTRGVHGARERWVPAFDGLQHSLGRAWYTDLEEGREATYFAGAAASDASVEAACPGLQDALLEALARVVGAPVARRRGWCGPGVHVFPAAGWLAENGGEVHFDLEGLSEAQLRDDVPALSLVAMLQPPEVGGGLGLWARRWREGVVEEAEGPPDAVAAYGAGDAVVFDSYRLHQIQPFGGGLDRISATVHAARDRGRWEAWF